MNTNIILPLDTIISSVASLSKNIGIDSLEQKHYRIVEEELQTLRESEQRLKQQNAESQRREQILVRRLALKEQEMQDYIAQIQIGQLKVAQPASLRNALLDPAINIIIQKLKVELQTTRARLEETQNELSAWKFTPDSTTGKRLMAKCRLLYQENEELGKMTSNGRLAKLEGDLALQKSFSEEVKKSQSELDDLLQELDEDVEGMQSTILFLQQELKTSKNTIIGLEHEIKQLKNGSSKSHRREDKDDDNCIYIVYDEHNHIDREVLKLNNSEKILRKDKQTVVGGKRVNDLPRTLRSSRLNDVARTTFTSKVNNNNSVNAEDADDIITVDDDEVAIGAEQNGDHRSSDDLSEPKSNNNKRSLDESVGTVATLLQPPATPVKYSSCNNKQLLKKARRSLDPNEEDSRIDCDEEDRTIIVKRHETNVVRMTD